MKVKIDLWKCPICENVKSLRSNLNFNEESKKMYCHKCQEDQLFYHFHSEYKEFDSKIEKKIKIK